MSFITKKKFSPSNSSRHFINFLYHFIDTTPLFSFTFEIADSISKLNERNVLCSMKDKSNENFMMSCPLFPPVSNTFLWSIFSFISIFISLISYLLLLMICFENNVKSDGKIAQLGILWVFYVVIFPNLAEISLFIASKAELLWYFDVCIWKFSWICKILALRIFRLFLQAIFLYSYRLLHHLFVSFDAFKSS